MAETLTLYEFGPTRSLRVRWALQELEVPFESVAVDLRAGEHRKPPFLQLNPAGRVPVLVDGDLVLTESVAIVVYLADKYPDKGLMTKDPRERAQALRWMLFAVTELEQPWWRAAKHRNLYPPELRIPADIELAQRDFAPMAQVMEQHMQAREFVVGSRVSVADFVLAYTLDVANELKWLSECPGLVAYIERMYRRPHAPPRVAQAFASLRQ